MGSHPPSMYRDRAAIISGKKRLGHVFSVVLTIFLCPLFYAPLPSLAVTGQEPITVDVRYVIDGDSLVVTKNGEEMEVRLWGIDAPEYDQPHSDSSREALKHLVGGRSGVLYSKYRDRYGRFVALLLIGNLNVNEEMVRGGHSWVYDRYCDEQVCERWKRLQAEAQNHKRGLWRTSEPIAPWQWKARR